MTRRRFELDDGKSAKFWEVEAKGTSVIVRFGKIGSAGQVHTKRLATSLGARLTVDKLVAEKEAKGYTLAGARIATVKTSPKTKGRASHRHAIDGFRIPDVAWRLLALDAFPTFLEPSHTLALSRAASVPPDTARKLGESLYDNHPFEISTYSHNGGDGLEYAWAIHAPELDLDDWPMVSWAPGDDGGARLLGRTTREGLSSLLVAAHLDWASYDADDKGPPPSKLPSWKKVVAILGAEPNLADPRVKRGGRISEPLVPDVPKGWRYEPGPDGIGVLAPADAFGRASFAAFSKRDSAEAACEEAERLLAEGPAGALVLAKRVRRWDGNDAQTIGVMRDAYRALGRTMHAQRADLWLSTHA